MGQRSKQVHVIKGVNPGVTEDSSCWTGLGDFMAQVPQSHPDHDVVEGGMLHIISHCSLVERNTLTHVNFLVLLSFCR